MKIRKTVREAVAGCSSGPIYYETKGHAWQAVCTTLNGFGFCLENADMPRDIGYRLFDIYAVDGDSAEPVGYVNLSWYRMQSGRYELTVYVA